MIKRSASELSLEDGTRAELAVDVGQIWAGGRSADLCEVEIELLEGSPTGLFEPGARRAWLGRRKGASEKP